MTLHSAGILACTRPLPWSGDWRTDPTKTRDIAERGRTCNVTPRFSGFFAPSDETRWRHQCVLAHGAPLDG